MLQSKFLLAFFIALFIALLLLYYFEQLNFSNDIVFGGAVFHQFIRQKPLRIAQVAPLAESVPPKGYGGTERIVSYLTEELVQRGYDITLFAASDSRTAAKLVSKWPSLRHHPNGPSRDEAFDWLMDAVRQRAHEFDVVHFHTDIHWTQSHQIFRDNKSVVVMTPHWVNCPMSAAPFRDFPLISISNNQRKSIGLQANFIGTVYHGIPKDLYKFVREPRGEGYLAFLGRMNPTKMPDWAIEIAVKAGLPLKMAAKIDDDLDYWQKQIKPMIDKHSDLVEYIGQVNDSTKNTFLGNAIVFLFPINWEEPFGMVMIEAMACGTPVVARRRGSVPEIVEEGVTGFLFDTIDDAVQAVHKARQLNRANVRRAFEKRFTVAPMADGYEAIYMRMLGNRPRKAELQELETTNSSMNDDLEETNNCFTGRKIILAQILFILFTFACFTFFGNLFFN